VWAEEAAARGRIACLQLLSQRVGLAPGCVELAPLLRSELLIFSGRKLRTAVWLVEQLTGEGVPEAQRHPLTAKVFAEAARSGGLPLLQLLRQRGCPWDETAWKEAAYGGCGAVLEWLHEAGCPKPVWQQDRATEQGDIHRPALRSDSHRRTCSSMSQIRNDG
jgi:hypothetical protein